MTNNPETRPRFTSGLFPHQIVAGASMRMDEDRDYRLSAAAYHLVVALSDISTGWSPRSKRAARNAEVDALCDF